MVALGRSGDYLDLPPSIMTKVSVKFAHSKIIHHLDYDIDSDSTHNETILRNHI